MLLSRRSLTALLFRGYCGNLDRGRILEREGGDIGTLRFPSKTRGERTSIRRSDVDSMGMGRKERGDEIRWLEIVQADYTFSFVLKYGGSQRENNVSLITRFGSTRATPAPRCSVPFLHPPSSLGLCPFVSLDLPSPSGSNAPRPANSCSETGIKMMFA